DYGTFVISSPMTIDGGGVGKIISPPSMHGIEINAGPVTIRNLTIVYNSPTNATALFVAFVGAEIENVVIAGTPCIGVYVGSLQGGAATATAKNVTVNGATYVGFFVARGSSASIRDSVFRGGNVGIQVGLSGFGGGTALIERCDLSFNTFAGLGVDATSGP